MNNLTITLQNKYCTILHINIMGLEKVKKFDDGDLAYK